MNLNLRQLAPGDFPLLYDLYRASNPPERTDRNRFLKTILLEPNFTLDSVTVAEVDGVPVGFVCAPVRRVPMLAGFPSDEGKGYVSVLAVAHPELIPSVGDALLEAAERRLIGLGKTSVTTGYFPLYLTQGPLASSPYADLYRRRGYEERQSVALCADLARYVPDCEGTEQKRRALLADGFYLGPLREEYLPSLLDPAAPFSTPSWSCEFRSRALAGRPDRFFLCAKNGRTVGVCVYGDPASDDCRFGPFGTDPAFRGRGIGNVLLTDCLCAMQKGGLPCAWLQWGADNGPAYHLYTKNGFTVEHRHSTFSKTLADGTAGTTR